ncbi:MAG TPA: hypothetical protein VFK36_03955 [Gemmatimonadales bacterium]|jgi:hypothetical protein|nr:hypothetical protein [Gemmatimonadales bacterium]HET8762606.1 hypothetical protein [Gemmatimonadales bacterium]
MKVATLVGILLLILGIIGFVAGGFSFTRNKTVIDAGPVQVTGKSREHVPLSPILSGLAVVGGIVLIVAGAKGSRG